MQILLFNLAAFAGACAQGMTGFGSGTLTVSLLVMLFPFRDVIATVAMVVLVPNLMLTWLTRHEMDWRRGPVAALGLSLGIVVGGQLLAILPAELLRPASISAPAPLASTSLVRSIARPSLRSIAAVARSFRNKWPSESRGSGQRWRRTARLRGTAAPAGRLSSLSMPTADPPS